MKEKVSKISGLVIGVLNLTALCFYIAFTFINKASIAADIFAILAFITICTNMIDCTMFSNRPIIKNAITIILYVINVAGNYIAGLSVIHLSISIVGICALLALFGLNACDKLMRVFRKKVGTSKKQNKISGLIFGLAGVGLLVSLFIVTILAVYAQGTSAINTNIVNLSMVLIALACFGLSLILVVLKDSKNRYRMTAIIASCIMFVLVALPFAITEGTGYTDAINAKASFVKAFGEEGLITTDNMSTRPYSFAHEFVGVRTGDYAIERDVEYYKGTEQNSELTLRYDVYYPTNENAHRAVLLNLHGAGGDKDIGNYAHRNKYFASRGYVVYDLQYGDFNEKNTGFVGYSSYQTYLYHIDCFFDFAVKNNSLNADFSNTFISGVSMGGGLTSVYGYFHSDIKDVTLKGIIPIYPGYSPIGTDETNYLTGVTKDSVPTLIFMSMSDVIVRTETLNETLEAYHKVGNPYCVAVMLSYAGHGCDSLMSGRSNQLINYYTERFMHVLRSR